MIYPTVHVGGTPRARLLENATTAREAIRLAIAEVSNTEPHARDFPNRLAGTFYTATRNHAQRMQALREMLQEYEALIEYLGSDSPVPPDEVIEGFG